jgi:hypothetical protein
MNQNKIILSTVIVLVLLATQVIAVGAAPVAQEDHPVGFSLADFFSDLLGVDYETIMEYHDDGAGFGTIAQALWMTHALEGDTTTFAAIVEAKMTNDFSAIVLPDGTTPKNWGQFRKAVMADREKSKENLGAIMSGRAGLPEEGGDQKGLGNLDKRTGKPEDKGQNKPEKPDNGNGNNGKGNGKGKNK